MMFRPFSKIRVLFILGYFFLAGILQPSFAQTSKRPSQAPKSDDLSVNWLYGSYIPKDAPRVGLTPKRRLRLYLNQTYLTPGIYLKTAIFATHDQVAERNSQWGQGIGGFAKRYADRQAQSIVQNSVTALGNGLLRWEPRYDRCQCIGFWVRTRHALARNFVTYDSSEKHLRPQLMPYLGAFSAAALATSWQSDRASWTVRGYQAAITQVLVGAGLNWLGEFAPEITRKLKNVRK